MKDDSLVSVLMPAYNAEKFIGKAISSILEQDYSNWELLILNDGSTDSTLTIIQEFKDHRINVTTNTENEGYLKSCNELFKLAKGEFVTFLDTDDTCPQNRLSDCLAVFQSKPKSDFLTTDHVKTDQHGNFISEHSIEVDYDKYASNSTYYPTICCATIILKKKLLRKVGGYHSFFDGIGGEDYHWLFRLSMVGKGCHLNKKLYNYRTHAQQLHERNSNPLKFFAKDIDQEIRTELILNENDLLNESNSLILKWNEYIKHYPEELLFRKAGWLLNNNEKKEGFKKTLAIIVKSPLSITSWYRFIYMSYSIIIR
ncbi:MAG: glycosyltransferase [Flavobacteriales bacterium]|nr:glycosyltransferase [Flavobacteriales bacterium]